MRHKAHPLALVLFIVMLSPSLRGGAEEAALVAPTGFEPVFGLGGIFALKGMLAGAQ